MSEQHEELLLSVPPELMSGLRELAARQFRTPEQQVLWLIYRGVHVLSTERVTVSERLERMQPVFTALRQALLTAGSPSLRVIARRTETAGFRISHTTVHALLNGRQAPSLQQLETIGGVLDADVPALRELWMEAMRDDDDPDRVRHQ